MSFASTLVLQNAAAANENFLRLKADPSTVKYVLESSTMSEPVHLIIGNQITTALDGSDRYMVKLMTTVLDSNGRPRTLPIGCTIAAPRVGIARTHVNDSIARLRSVLGSASFVDALLRGEL